MLPHAIPRPPSFSGVHAVLTLSLIQDEITYPLPQELMRKPGDLHTSFVRSSRFPAIAWPICVSSGHLFTV